MACWGGLDLPNIAGAEQILRKCQMHGYVYVMDRDPHHGGASASDGGGVGGDKKKRGHGCGRGAGRHGLLSFGFDDESAAFA
eukprot:6747014-Pyramimonas_sp.AAC.1